MNQTFLLKDIAKIQPGFSFRGKIESIPNGKYQVLQIKDIDDNGTILKDDLLRTDCQGLKDIYLVKKGDVLFTTRGVKRRAACVAKEIPDTIFVAQISCLRNIKEGINPAYVAWYLNQKPAQEYFIENASGSYIANIKQKVLGSLKIEVPSVETQEKIAEIYRLHQQESKLVEMIQSRRDQVIEQTLINAIKKGE